LYVDSPDGQGSSSVLGIFRIHARAGGKHRRGRHRPACGL